MDKKEEEKKKKYWLLILLLLLIICGLVWYIFFGNTKTKQEPVLDMEQTQSTYVKPEEPIDRSKNVTLPGWGGFTIPANTSTITQGFEFHNPEENMWYEDIISINDQELEKLVVDSGNQVELEHYLKLAGINSTISKVKSYDKDYFTIEDNKVEAIQGFEGNKTIEVETTDGNTITLTITCNSECYYMTFGLYLEDNDEQLYQSNLVAPGKYIQQMEMTRSLKPGTYDAYVEIQPYKSDKTTKTNQGVVRITLTVK